MINDLKLIITYNLFYIEFSGWITEKNVKTHDSDIKKLFDI